MNPDTPRILLAAANSGAGKTTVTCAVLQAFVNRGVKTASFKCGPDYIDPMFHSEVIGAKSRNLDLFFYGESTANYLLCKNAEGCGLSVLEGVMGFYDGVGGTTVQASSYHLARATATPVVLVLSARGMSLSAAAVVRGLAAFRPESNIKAVVLNHCSPMSYPMLKKIIEEEAGVPVAGFLPTLADCSLESRHLGLVTAAEVQNLREKLSALAAQAEKTIDLDLLWELAHTAPPPVYSRPAVPAPLPAPVRVAVARDAAFCFYYEDSLDLLRELGAELVPFSPLECAALPPDTDGLLLGGGYPELYAKRLAENAAMRESVRAGLAAGLPCIAECGGFLYLHETLEGADGEAYPMAGVIAAAAHNAHKLCRFGYVTLTANRENLLCAAGERIAAHEFHYWESGDCGEGFAAEKPVSGRGWQCAHTSAALYAGFAHLHFYSNPAFAKNFLLQCEAHRKARDQK